MLRTIEASGRSIDEAIFNGLKELEISIDEVEIDIIQHESKGILGIGAKPAIVKLIEREPEDISLPEYLRPEYQERERRERRDRREPRQDNRDRRGRRDRGPREDREEGSCEAPVAEGIAKEDEASEIATQAVCEKPAERQPRERRDRRGRSRRPHSPAWCRPKDPFPQRSDTGPAPLPRCPAPAQKSCTGGSRPPALTAR